MTSSIILPFLSFLEPLGVRANIRLRTLRLDVQRFQSISLDGEHRWAYDNRYGVDSLSAVGGWVKRWMNWGGCAAVLRCDEATYLDMHIIRCADKEIYVRGLASIFGGYLSRTDDPPVTYSLDYVAFRSAYYALHFLTNFDCLLKEIVLKPSFCIQKVWDYLWAGIVLTSWKFRLVHENSSLYSFHVGGQVARGFDFCLHLRRSYCVVTLRWSSWQSDIVCYFVLLSPSIIYLLSCRSFCHRCLVA